MNPYKSARISAIAILTALLLVIETPPFIKRAPVELNVILLTVDSLRPDHLGCYGYNRMTSPNIDAIAERGVLFRRAYSQSVWTIPGLMSVVTSLQPPVHKVDERGRMLDPDIVTIFDCFRDAPYTVPNICFLLTIPEFSSIRVGPVEEEYFSHEDGEELFRWLDENHNKRFFIWYHYRNVHLPYKPREVSQSGAIELLLEQNSLSPGIKAILSDAATVPMGTVTFEESDAPIIRELYDAEVRELDSFVGRLYARLQRHGLLQKTLLVITADHGEELLDHGFVGHASTMHSATMYDEVLRIPLIMSLADYLPNHLEIREQVQQIDIMPTVLDIVGIPIPPGVQGRNLAPLLFDVTKQSESSVPVFAETIYGGYQATEHMAKTRLRCIRTDAWKLIETESPEGKASELFDLLLDPRELKNVYRENLHAAAVLQTLLAEWQVQNRMRIQTLRRDVSALTSTVYRAECPQMLIPSDGAALRFRESGGLIHASWTGNPTATYIIEYDIGTGVHHLTGTFLTMGSERDFGPYSREMWSSLAVRNPWRIRISPDTHPRCWSEWIQFTFAP
ncbi:MAG: DUF4976 domain-containing protein [Candidatus Abyssobacteria bacterium SURF_17]|uniref:DUF4976 domain-containing protein n=1 Tax=Candidatus Abyssobacteria bacterium SURF_17 TaxID=2093361 RepID=A0A419F0T1_9BACT|nr:MAG: DUF4976 domain-containing protein [Candidatus Abyssubacteria bacterium SURF_17]